MMFLIYLTVISFACFWLAAIVVMGTHHGPMKYSYKFTRYLSFGKLFSQRSCKVASFL